MNILHFLCLVGMLVSVGCSRQYTELSQNNDATTIFFADLANEYYELGPPIQPVSNTPQSSGGLSQSIQGNFSQLSYGLTVQSTDTYKTNSQQIDSYSNKVYAITKTNALVVESNGTTTTLIDRIYPPPRQLVNVNDAYIYYHDKLYIYRIDIRTNKITKLLDEPMPIHTIDVDRHTNDIYFSLSTSGKIYKLNRYGRLYNLHAPVTAIGGPLNYQESTKKLYFTVSNGRDTTIRCMSRVDGMISDHATVFRRSALSELHIVDE